jgi:hypothetical protein
MTRATRIAGWTALSVALLASSPDQASAQRPRFVADSATVSGACDQIQSRRGEAVPAYKRVEVASVSPQRIGALFAGRVTELCNNQSQIIKSADWAGAETVASYAQLISPQASAADGAAANALLTSACQDKEILVRVTARRSAGGNARIQNAWVIAKGTLNGVQESLGVQLIEGDALMPPFKGDYDILIFVQVDGKITKEEARVSGIVMPPSSFDSSCIRHVVVDV